MDMPEVEDINMLEERDYSSNHQLGEEGMNMVDIHMVEVECMDMVEEHSSNHRVEVVLRHFHRSRSRAARCGSFAGKVFSLLVVISR
jgi:hypothetical protein